MICSRCGREFNPISQVCPYCGNIHSELSDAYDNGFQYPVPVGQKSYGNEFSNQRQMQGQFYESGQNSFQSKSQNQSQNFSRNQLMNSSQNKEQNPYQVQPQPYSIQPMNNYQTLNNNQYQTLGGVEYQKEPVKQISDIVQSLTNAKNQMGGQKQTQYGSGMQNNAKTNGQSNNQYSAQNPNSSGVMWNPGDKECTFDGTGGQIFLLSLGLALAIVFSLGLAGPWAMTKLLRWQYSHTYIRGRQLSYTGTAMELFLKSLVWGLLTLVTFGIYGLFLPHFLIKWMNPRVCYADTMTPIGQQSPGSFYDGDVGGFLGTYIVAAILIDITCGIAYPWEVVRFYKFYNSHTVIDGDRLEFHGNGGAAWGYLFLIVLLSGVTLGFYYPWGMCKFQKWIWENTSVQSSGNVNYNA